MPGAGYADTRFGSIHYREAGEGDPLLLLHATPRSSGVYLPIMPFLADRFRVIAPDTLGFGDSAPLPANVTMEILAESVTALMDELGISRAAIFGLHTGNKIGAALAAGWPERVSRFMCCGMTHSLIVDQDKRNDAIGDIVAPYMAVEEAKGSRNLAEEWAKLFRSVEEIRQGQELRAPAQPGPEAFAAAEARVLDQIQAWPSIDPIYRANFAFDLGAALRRVQAPTLVLELATVEEAHFGLQAENVKALLPHGEALVMENTDRGVLEENPGYLARVLADFLAH